MAARSSYTGTEGRPAYEDYRPIAKGAVPAEDEDEDDQGFVNRATFRAQTEALIELYALPEWRRDEVQLMQPYGGGHDGRVYQLFRDHRKYAVKRFRDGISTQLVDFHRALRECRSAGVALDTVRRAVVPLAFLQYKGQRCLVYPWIEHDPARALTASDVAALRAQVDLCHALGFCHLDITARNVLRTEEAGAVLIDYDCVTRVGTAPLCGTPPESSARVQRRDAVRLEDDEHLWTLLLRGM